MEKRPARRFTWSECECGPHYMDGSNQWPLTTLNAKWQNSSENAEYSYIWNKIWVCGFEEPGCGWPGSGCVVDQGPDVQMIIRMCGFEDPDVWMTRVRLSRWRRLMPPPMGKKSLHTGVEVTHNKSADVAPQDRHISITLVVKSWWSMFDFREEKLRERKMIGKHWHQVF